VEESRFELNTMASATTSTNQECFNWKESRSCRFGKDCRFIHAGEETRGSQRKTTQPCWTFKETGTCEYAGDCRFSHDPNLKVDDEKKPAKKSADAPRAPKAPRPRDAAATTATADDEDDADVDGKAKRRRRPRRKRGAAETTEETTVSVPSESQSNTRLECRKWKEDGTCQYGTNCRFLHGGEVTRGAARKTKEVCFALRDGGECKFGEGCRYSHDLSVATDSKPAGKPRNRPRKECFRFREGDCSYGDKCRFSHDLAATEEH